MKTVRKLLSMILIIAMLFTSMAPAASAVEADANIDISLEAVKYNETVVPPEYGGGINYTAVSAPAVKAGEHFFVRLKFSGNDTANTAHSAELLMQFDSSVVDVVGTEGYYVKTAKDNVTKNQTIDGATAMSNLIGGNVIFLATVKASGFTNSNSTVLTEGYFGEIEFVAKADLDTSKLAKFAYLESNGTDVSKITRDGSNASLIKSMSGVDVNIVVSNSAYITGDDTIAVAQDKTTVNQPYAVTVVDKNGVEFTPADVAWSLDAGETGVQFDAVNGKLVVDYSDKAGTVTLTATVKQTDNADRLEKDVTATKTITITKAAPVLAEVWIDGINDIAIPGIGSDPVQVTIGAKDQYGEKMSLADCDAALYRIIYDNDSVITGREPLNVNGISLDKANNKLIITSDAAKSIAAGETLYADVVCGTKRAYFIVNRAASVPTTVEFAANAVDAVIIPADDAAAVEIACTGCFIVKDQYGAEMADQTVVLALKDAYTNVSVSNNKLTVAPDAVPGTVTLVATVEGTSVSAEKDVTLSYAGDILKSMEITVAKTHDSTSAKNVPLTITGKNQYGNTMTPANVTWAIAPDNDMVEISGNTLTIAEGAYGNFTLSATNGTISATPVEITVNGLYTTGAIDNAQDVEYGDKYETVFAGKNGISVFYGDGVGDTALSGTWAISPETATTVGNETVVFTFTSTDNAYTYTTTKTVNVAKRTLAASDFVVTPASITKEYDGTTEVISSLGFTWKTGGNVLSADESFLSVAFTGVFNSANVKEADNVIVTITELTGDKADCYQLPAEGITINVPATITPVKVTKPVGFSTLYTGQPCDVVKNYDSNTAPYQVFLIDGEQEVETNQVTDAGNYTFKFRLKDKNNYIWNNRYQDSEDVTCNVTIKKFDIGYNLLTASPESQSVILGQVADDAITVPTITSGYHTIPGTVITYQIGETIYTYDALIDMLQAQTEATEFTVSLIVKVNETEKNYEGEAKLNNAMTIRVVDMDFELSEGWYSAANTVYGNNWGSMITLDTEKMNAVLGTAEQESKDYALVYPAGAAATDIPDVGTYTVGVVFTGDDGKTYDVPGGIEVTVTKKPLDASMVTVTNSNNIIFDGNPKTPVVVSDGDLMEAADYTVSYELEGEATNINAGTATATITATEDGNYSGSITKTFTIQKASIAGKSVTLTPNEFTFDNNAKQPNVEVNGLAKDTDFTVAYSNNINAGTATVTITGKGNYTGELTKTFKINPKTLEGTVVLSETEFTYDGKSKTPSATIEGLKEGTDFTVKYSDNKNVGTATVTVTGKGNYTGTLTKTFEIKKADAPETLTTEYVREYKFSKTGEKFVSLMGIPADAGEVTYGELTVTDAKGIIDTEVAADGKVTFNFTGLSAYEAGVTATIAFDLTMDNYKTETITVTIKVLDKSVPNVQVANLVMDYTGVAADVSVLTKTSDVPGTWEWVVNPTNMPARAEAYTASVKFIPEDAVEYAEKTVNFTVTIKKATASVDSDVDMDEDNVVTPDRDDETLNDVLTAGDFSVDGTLVWTVTDEDGNVTHPTGDTKLEDIEGEITWTFTPDDTNNYTVINGSVEDDDYSWLIPGMGIAGVIIGSTSKNFKDVPTNAWYAKAVDFVVGRGLFNGVSDKEFNPDGSMTRAMLVTVLWRLEGEPVVGYGNNFRDVESGAWYYDAVTWASAEGIVNGYDAYTFGPNNLITREQMATILYRYAQMRNFNTDFHADLSKYADNGSISGYAREAMSWAVGTGIITGMTETTLNPAGTATRAQVATILMRFIRWYSL